MTIDEFRKDASSQLEKLYGAGEAGAIISYLMGEVLGYSPIEISMHRLELLSVSQQKKLDTALARLHQYEPVQYVTGVAHFWGLRLYVTPAVLIPRQETEELVDWIVKENPQPDLSVLDIGTGSGCIAISLALEMKKARVSAMDYSEEPLRVAQQNAAAHQRQIAFYQQDILRASPTDFEGLDILASNPPYIREIEKAEMMPHVLEHEPEAALFVPDEDPLLFYRKIAELGKSWLGDGGKIYFEINEAFGDEVVALLKSLNYEEVVLRKDLNGKDRMVRGRKSSEF